MSLRYHSIREKGNQPCLYEGAGAKRETIKQKILHRFVYSFNKYVLSTVGVQEKKSDTEVYTCTACKLKEEAHS
jgi:hypothetical protein